MPTEGEVAQQPRLKSLATKPLKLVGSLVSSRSNTAAPTPSASAVSLPALNAASAQQLSLSDRDRDSAHTISDGAFIQPDTLNIPAPRSSGRRMTRRRRGRKHLQAQDLTAAQIASATRGPRKPLEGEEPAAVLRVRVVKADGLVAKDRNGHSDP